MRISLTTFAAMLLAGAACPLAAQPSPAPDIPLGKLGDAAVPAAYRLSLTVRPDQPTFTGHAEIDVTLARETASLFLHGNGLKIAKATATAGGRTVTGRFEQVDPSGVARLTFDRPLPAGEATLVFDYTAPFGSQSEGLYHAKVGDDWYAWTQMEPIDARRMFPSFDEPGFKTPFTVSITAPAASKVFANTPEVKVTPAAEGMARHDFAASKPLPTYLVAIAVGAFDVVEGVVPANAVSKAPLPYRVIAT